MLWLFLFACIDMLRRSSQKVSPYCALKLLVDKQLGRNSFLGKRGQCGMSRAVDHAAGHAAEPKRPEKQCQTAHPSTQVHFLEAQILFNSLIALMTNGTPIGPSKGR